jgi:hypothetical protein
MKLVPIFDISKHTLLAIQYDGEEVDEFKKAFNNWADVTYLRNFFKEHESDLLHGYYKCASIKVAVANTQSFAKELEQLIYEKADGNATQVQNMLESVFRALNDTETDVYDLQKSKLKKSWIRIYAIRIAPNCYVVTGSAIKLVHQMQEKDYLIAELQNLDKVKNFLKQNDLIDEESFEFLELKG